MKNSERASDKEKVIAILKECYHKAVSKKDFFERVKESGMDVYSRGGNFTGIIYAGRKFRFKRIEFEPEILEGLDVGVERRRELEKIRGKVRSKWHGKDFSETH